MNIVDSIWSEIGEAQEALDECDSKAVRVHLDKATTLVEQGYVDNFDDSDTMSDIDHAETVLFDLMTAVIKAKTAGDLAAYESSDDLPKAVEMTLDDLGGNAADDGYLTKADDWTLSADERRTSGERQQRAEDALLTTNGALWWGAMTPSGFGPVALAELGSGSVVTYDGTEVITTVDTASPDDVRVDAGFIPMGQFRSKGRKGGESGMYRDFIRSARMFAADDEQADLWTESGYSWERLDDNELAAELPSFTAYWE